MCLNRSGKECFTKIPVNLLTKLPYTDLDSLIDVDFIAYMGFGFGPCFLLVSILVLQ